VLLLVAGMAWVALVYTGPVPTFTQLSEWNDKVLHVCGFALPAALLVLPGSAPRALLVLVLGAAGLELVQMALPMRQASLADLIASMAGIAAGWLIIAACRAVVAFVAGTGRRSRGERLKRNG
jgi:hypothetical protein